jgi:hypothetical protein
MFANCKKLTATPKLPAESLVTECYITMFFGCTSLTKAYVKAAYDATDCANMFYNCANTSAVTLYTDGDWSGCTDISNWNKVAYPTE